MEPITVAQAPMEDNVGTVPAVRIEYLSGTSIAAYRASSRYFLNPPAYSHGPIVSVAIVLNDEWHVATDNGRRRLVGPATKPPLSLDQAVQAGVARVL